MDHHAQTGAPAFPVDPWDDPMPEPAQDPGYGAGEALQASLPQEGPFAFDLPDHELSAEAPPQGADPAAVLHMERKLPRHLHLWFAGGLALLTLGALALQSWVSAAGAPAAGSAGTGTPSREAEPPLLTLQRELAREKGAAGPGTSLSQWPPSPPAPVRGAARSGTLALAAPVPAGALLPGAGPAGFPVDVSGGPTGGLPGAVPGGIPDGAPGDVPDNLAGAMPGMGAAGVPPELLPDPAAGGERGYEQAKAQAVIAGSRILALSHVPATLAAGEAGGAPSLDRTQLLATLLRSAPELLRSLPELVGASRDVLAGGSGAASDGATGEAAAGSRAGGVADTSANAMVLRGQAGNAGIPAALPLGPPARAPVILEGTPIPCVLQTELRSDLPGMIVAQVADDVYDSVTAQRRLIPRGTRLIGHYDSQVAGGQQRLMASFHRLILPDGASLDLQRMDAADMAGSAGLEDQVDTHFLARFGQAFLTAGLARAAQRDGSPVASSTSGGVLPGPDATGQILVDTARTSLQMGTTLAPTLIIRRGTQFNVMVNRDLRLPELPLP